ncbi:MAG: cytochrome b, partial [Nakamurella sp.]
LPSGEFIEVHQPLGGVDAHGHPIPLEYQGASVPKKMNQLGYAGKAVNGVISVKDETGLIHQVATDAPSIDGHTTNGHTTNGHTTNGHTTNGHTTNSNAAGGALTSGKDATTTGR